MASDKSMNIVMAICHSHTRPEIVAEAKRELAVLKAKAAELDRREKGVAVKSYKGTFGVVHSCGECDFQALRGEKYCSICGTKLIWDSEV